MWEILKTAGVDPAPSRATVTWAGFLRSQAEAILAVDFIETVTLTGQRQYILAAIHHAGHAKCPELIDKILGAAGIATVLTGVRMPRMNSIFERWVKTLRTELLDRTLIWNQTHLRHALREYERHYDEHRTHRSLAAAAPLRVRPQPLEPDQIERLTIDRQDRLGGVIHEYRHAA